jgi:glyoxylase-like metal-dependent hydrolase (beta-lactamase superfamily II)
MVDVMSSSGMVTAFRASTCVTRLRPSLFPGGVGKTWKRGDFTQLLTDVTSRVFDVYPDSTVVYPGHGDDTTLGTERPHLGEWRERGW